MYYSCRTTRAITSCNDMVPPMVRRYTPIPTFLLFTYFCLYRTTAHAHTPGTVQMHRHVTQPRRSRQPNRRRAAVQTTLSSTSVCVRARAFIYVHASTAAASYVGHPIPVRNRKAGPGWISYPRVHAFYTINKVTSA